MLIPKSHLVLGGARSGKSAYGESLAIKSGLDCLYLATSQVWDEEMAARIAKHKQARGPEWTCVEEPLRLVEALEAHSRPERIILVDCLTLWLTNLMLNEDLDVTQEAQNLVAALPFAGPVILVSNEVGQGIVPDNKMARQFRDHAGRLHQDLAAKVEAVTFVTAGLPQTLKTAH